MFAIPVLWKHRQEDCYKFEVNLGCMVSSRPDGLQSETPSQNNKTKQTTKTVEVIDWW